MSDRAQRWCRLCHKLKPHRARGLCDRCYQREHYWNRLDEFDPVATLADGATGTIVQDCYGIDGTRMLKGTRVRLSVPKDE